MEDCVKCELIGGWSSRHLNTFSNFFVDGCTQNTYHYMLCIVVIVVIVDSTHVATPCCPKYHNIAYIVVIVDCTIIGSGTTSFEDLVTLHRSTL